jgi:hypothetical protein
MVFRAPSPYIGPRILWICFQIGQYRLSEQLHFILSRLLLSNYVPALSLESNRSSTISSFSDHLNRQRTLSVNEKSNKITELLILNRVRPSLAIKSKIMQLLIKISKSRGRPKSRGATRDSFTCLFDLIDLPCVEISALKVYFKSNLPRTTRVLCFNTLVIRANLAAWNGI